MVSVAEIAYADQARRRVTDAIRRHGCWCTYVPGVEDDGCGCPACTAPVPVPVDDPQGPGSPSPTDLAYACTTGLHGVGHPELVVLGLSEATSAHLLTSLAHQVIAGGDLVPGEVVEVEGVRLLVEQVPNPGEVFLVSDDYYDRPPGSPVAGLQLSWADHMGRFPGDPGCSEVALAQPRPGDWRA